jgi:hypothetical protein
MTFLIECPFRPPGSYGTDPVGEMMHGYNSSGRTESFTSLLYQENIINRNIALPARGGHALPVFGWRFSAGIQ